jgi:hypothetical protein
MADRYSNRPFSAESYDRGGDQYGSDGNDSDPLAELARLIGQTDPFAATGRAHPAPMRPAREQQQPRYQEPAEDDEPRPAGPPQWMQRANIQRQQVGRQSPPNLPYAEPEDYPSENYQGQGYQGQDYQGQDYQGQDYSNTVHPLHRYAAQTGGPRGDYHAASHDQADDHADPSRYDDALYGELEAGAQDFRRDPAYPNDPYAYQDGYEGGEEEQPTKRRGGLITVAAVLALAVVGTGAAFAYRTYVGSPRSGDPPIIKADNTPTKIVPAPADASSKTPDRMPTGDGTEKLVPREETPVDVNTRAAGPRVVFPPLNANNNPPTPSSVSPSIMSPPGGAAAAIPSNGTMPNSEPRKIKTFSVHGEQSDSAAPVAAAPATIPAKPVTAATRQIPPRVAPAPASGNTPLSLAPDSAQASMPPAPAEPRTRVAATTPTQVAPASEPAPATEGRFMVSITSQSTEAEAQASYRAMQRKYPNQLGSRSAVIKRTEDNKHYRALVGPFASRDEAARFCTSYRSAGGQCWIP